MKGQDWSVPFEEQAENLLREREIPGMSVGLAKRGNLIYHNGFGYRDLAKQLEINVDTVFGIASITKSVTCVAIMQLQEARKLSVHDLVVSYLPELADWKVNGLPLVSIHHLMTHTSGIPPMPTLYAAVKQSAAGDPALDDLPNQLNLESYKPIDTFNELLEFLRESSIELLGQPGTQFSYSNDGYALLGAIIERVSGKSYERYIQEHILEPAGMNRSSFFVDEWKDRCNVTTLYSSKLTGENRSMYEAPVWWDAPSMRATGFLISTARDLLRYAEIFRTGGVVHHERLLTAKSVEEITHPHVVADLGSDYGYGLYVRNHHGCKLLEHSGGLKGIASHLMMVPEVGLSGIALANHWNAPANRVLLQAVNAYHQREVDEPYMTYSDYAIPQARLQDYIGPYTNKEGMHVVIDQQGGQLRFCYDSACVPLRSVENDYFACDRRGVESLIGFIRDQNGKVVRMMFGGRQLLKF